MKSLLSLLLFSMAIFSIQSSPIRGQWTSIAVANTITSVPFKITDSQIRVEYSGVIVYGYKLDGNRITVNLISANEPSAFLNKKPSHSELKSCIANFHTYELKGDMIQIKSQDGKLMAQMRKTGDVAAGQQHPLVTSPVVNPTPPRNSPAPAPIPVPVQTVVFRDPGILKNKWKVNVIKGIPVIFPIQITSTNIQFQFCNRQSLPFTVSHNNSIKIQNRIVSTGTCEHLYPPEVDVVKAFAESTSYDVNDYFLYLKRGNDINVFLERIQ